MKMKSFRPTPTNMQLDGIISSKNDYQSGGAKYNRAIIICHRNTKCQDPPLPPKYSGQWWASNLIKQIIYYSLNEWQIRNNKLHADLTENQYNTDRTNLKHEVQEWYSRQTDSTLQRTDQALFRKTLLERLQEPNFALQNWCDTFALVYRYNTNIQEQQNGRVIRDIYTVHST